MTTCLVTGSSGFVGRKMLTRLREWGVEAWSTTRGGAGRQSILWPDIATPAPQVRQAFDYVLHLAAITDLRACNADPTRAYLVNAEGVGHAVELARQTGARIVYLSTLGVYGNPRYLPIDEAHPLAPIEFYSTSKLRGEKLLTSRAEELGVPWAIVRSFNAYGPGQDPSRVVPAVVSQVLNSETVIVRDKLSTRDFVFIDDLCEAIWGVATSEEQQIFNVGTGLETSIYELVESVAQLCKKTVKIEVRSDLQYPVVTRSQADISRIRRCVGWIPKTTLQTGLATVIRSARATERAREVQ